MTDSLRTGKRVLAVSVAIATMAWAIGLATLLAPLSARAATVASGSLIKGSLAAVYYYGADGKRYVFPNEKTYKTWYPDFSTVQTISDSELAAIFIGGNVTYRPGVKMIKITSDNRVYAVAKGGTLRWVKTEAAAATLYGSDWNKKIDDVSDAFFTNYTIGADINVASDFSPSSEIAAATSINVDKNIGGTPLTGNVTVSMSAKSPSSMSIPTGAFYAPLLVLNVKNNTAAEVKLTGLTINRTGILSDSNINGVLVTDGAGILHGSLVTFGQSVAMPGFASDPIKIAANASMDVTLAVNIKTGTFSGTVGASVNAASGVLVTDSAGAALVVGGAFPINGQMMNIVDGTGALGRVELSSRTIVGGTKAAPIDIDQGAKDLDVAKFRFQEVSGNEDVELMNVEIQNNGSASAGDVMNIRLLDQDDMVVAQTDSLVNNVAKFSILNMTGAKAGMRGGYKIANGQLRDFKVRIDTAANTNSADRTVNFTMQNDFRVRIVGQETGVGVTPVVSGTDTFPLGDGTKVTTDDNLDGANFVKFRPGSLTLSRATESLSGKLAKGATNVPLATFDLRAFGEAVEVQEVGFVVLNAAGSGLAVGSTVLSGTVKINNASGNSIFSLTATDPTAYSTNLTSANIVNSLITTTAANGTGTQRVLSSFYTVGANTTGKLVFVADVNQSALSTDGYKVRITSIKFRKTSSNTIATNSGLSVDGNGLTVEASDLTVSKSAAYNPINLVKGGSVQKVASFDLQAGAAEGQNVNSIKVRICTSDATIVIADCSNTTASDAISDDADIANVTNVTLKVADLQLGTSLNISNSAGGTFSTQLQIAANQTKTVDVYAVVNSAYARSKVALSMEVTSSTGTSSQATITKAAVLGQEIAVTSGGVLSFTNLGNDGVINVAKLLHASESDIPMFKFKVRESSNAESISVGKVYIAVKNARNTFGSYKLYDELTGQQLGVSNTPIIRAGTAGEVRFGGLTMNIPKGGEMNLIVKGSSVDAATMPTTLGEKDVKMGISFVEYTGGTSGITTRESGGQIIGQNTSEAAAAAAVLGTYAAGDFLQVNDTANFEVGDLVQVDYNNDFAFNTTTYGAQGGTIQEVGPQFVKTVNANTVTFASYYRASVAAATEKLELIAGGEGLVTDSSPAIAVGDTVRVDFNADGDFLDTFAVTGGTRAESEVFTVATFDDTSADDFTLTGVLFSADTATPGVRVYITSKTQTITGAFGTTGTNSTIGGAITKYAFSSFNHEVQEVEPMITGLNVGSGNQVVENELGTFTVRAEGARSMNINKFRFEVSGSYNANGTNQSGGGFAPKAFRLDRADPTTGNRISNTMSSGASLGGSTLVFTASGGVASGALVNGAIATGITTVVIDTGVPTLIAGDRFTFASSTNGGVGYKIVTVNSTTSITFTPGAQVAIPDNDALTALASNPVVGDTAILESGAVIQFDLVAATLSEEVPANSSKGYVLMANTTKIKDNTASGTTAQTQVRLLGGKAATTSPTPNTDGLEWTYTKTADGLNVGALSISDSYIVSGKALLYQ